MLNHEIEAKGTAGFTKAARRSISSSLLIGLCELSLSHGIDAIIGFFDKPMWRIYHRIGWVPTIIAKSDHRPDSVVGRWSVTPQALEGMRSRISA